MAILLGSYMFVCNYIPPYIPCYIIKECFVLICVNIPRVLRGDIESLHGAGNLEGLPPEATYIARVFCFVKYRYNNSTHLQEGLI